MEGTQQQAPVKKLILAHKQEVEVERQSYLKQAQACQAEFVPDLTMEEGMILLRRWNQNNFIDFGYWLEIAEAVATYEIEEKLSLNSKPHVDKTVKIKNFQCHLRLSFHHKRLETLVCTL